MAKIALVFPGQASQYVGMGRELSESFPSSSKVLEEANNILGYDLKKIIFEGPLELLTQTEFTQPAVYVASVMALKALESRYDIKDVICVAGHSLGEYSALYAAGVFNFADGLNLVKQRAGFIKDASEKNKGGMTAVLGLDESKIREVCSSSGAEAVNFNSPGQVVIAGSYDSLSKAASAASSVGALKVVPLNVSGAFHSSLMKEAAERMKEVLSSAQLINPRVPVFTNCDSKPTTSAEEIRNKLFIQIDHPVLWEASVRNMISLGVEAFVEVGPGKVLSGLIKRIERKIKIYNIEDVKTLEDTLSKINS